MKAFVLLALLAVTITATIVNAYEPNISCQNMCSNKGCSVVGKRNSEVRKICQNFCAVCAAQKANEEMKDNAVMLAFRKYFVNFFLLLKKAATNLGNVGMEDELLQEKFTAQLAKRMWKVFARQARMRRVAQARH